MISSAGTGYPYPIPLHLVPVNIYVAIQFIRNCIFGPTSKLVNKARADHGIDHDRFHRNLPPVATVCPSLPELDFDYSNIPSNMYGDGPILWPNRPSMEVDKELEDWLSKRPTILVNLGTHFISTASSALATAKALATILSENKELQVLWKIKYTYHAKRDFISALKEFLDTDRIRITKWLKPTTPSILSSSNIVLFIHHGGLNSYYEACYAGVPHVILPTWYDTYQTAAKVEFLVIGVYASKKSAPKVREEGLTVAMRKVLGSDDMRGKARELGNMYRARKGGREVAVDLVEELVRGLV